tara:strand:- start:2122 stop:2265 length:144 start_codon:yes stop_codon:yes gene_type:complete
MFGAILKYSKFKTAAHYIFFVYMMGLIFDQIPSGIDGIGNQGILLPL